MRGSSFSPVVPLFLTHGWDHRKRGQPGSVLGVAMVPAQSYSSCLVPLREDHL
jgi:hypothetical protein